jgi:sporulation protein YlmC with PRC-barrel domain
MANMREKLVGKMVRSECGIPIGVIKQSLTDEDSGKIISLLLSPAKSIDLDDYQFNEKGDIVLPYQDIAPVKDALVFEDTIDYKI